MRRLAPLGHAGVRARSLPRSVDAVARGQPAAVGRCDRSDLPRQRPAGGRGLCLAGHPRHAAQERDVHYRNWRAAIDAAGQRTIEDAISDLQQVNNGRFRLVVERSRDADPLPGLLQITSADVPPEVIQMLCSPGASGLHARVHI